MKKHITFISALCLMATLWNCGPLMDWLSEDVDEGEYVDQTFKPEKGKYYLFENEYPSDYEWDWQIFKDDTLMSVKDDTLRKQILCRIGSATKDEYIVIKSDYDGIVQMIGTEDSLYNVTYNEDKISLWNIGKDGNLTTKELSYSKTLFSKKNESRGFLSISSKTVENIFKTGEALLTAADATEKGIIAANRTRYSYQRFGIDISQNFIAAGIGACFAGPVGAAAGFTASAAFTFINNKMASNNEEIIDIFYGNYVNINIDDVKEISDGVISVDITINNVNSIPSEIPYVDNKGLRHEGRNFISIEVLAKREYVPYTDYYDASSGEVSVNINSSNSQTFNLILPPLKGGKYMIRPYIKSRHDLLINDAYNNFIQNIDGDFVVYGESSMYEVNYLNIKGTNPKKLVYDYSTGKLVCSYSVEVEKNIDDLSGKKIIDYGIYEYSGGDKKTFSLENIGDKNKGYIQISENPEDVTYDYKNYTGTIERRFGTYISTMIVSKDPVIETSYSEEKDYTLTFQMEKPTIEIQSVKLIETKEVYSTYGYSEVAAPAIGLESHFQVHVVDKSMPFGYSSWVAGGEFYTARGGTATHPTPAELDIQNIAATIKEESKDNINYYYEVYVTKYHTDSNIGENPLYFGFKSKFTETDSIVSKNFIKFNYVPNPLLDVDGGYKTAEILTGKMPDYIPITKYAKE